MFPEISLELYVWTTFLASETGASIIKDVGNSGEGCRFKIKEEMRKEQSTSVNSRLKYSK
jgi:hypothetical protein